MGLLKVFSTALRYLMHGSKTKRNDRATIQKTWARKFCMLSNCDFYKIFHGCAVVANSSL